MIGSEKQTPASADVNDRVSEYYWRFVLAHRRAEHVRRSDDHVVASRIMTRDEIERELRRGDSQSSIPKPEMNIAQTPERAASGSENGGKKGEESMERDSRFRERAEAMIGKEFNNLTIRKIVGKHPTSGATLVEAQCRCGNIVPSAMLSDITKGRKAKCGRGCTASPAEKASRQASAGAGANGNAKRAVKGRRPGKKGRAKAIRRGDHRSGDAVAAESPTTRQLNRFFSDAENLAAVANGSGGPALVASNGNWRGSLRQEADTLRRAAVGILAGKASVEELAEALRRQADKLDELIYSEG